MPGIMLPAQPQDGQKYRQEYKKGEAEDNGEVIATDASGPGQDRPLQERIGDHGHEQRRDNRCGVQVLCTSVGPLLALDVSGGAAREELVKIEQAGPAAGTGPIGKPKPYPAGCGTIDEGAERANSCQSANPTRHYDELVAPTTAGACEVSNDEHPLCNAGDEGVGTREQLVRVPIQHGYGSPSMIVKSLISVRVLIVEDEPKLASLLRKGLTAEGFAADLANNADEAMWMAAATAYDAITLDVMLPGHRRIHPVPRFSPTRSQYAGADDHRARHHP